MRSRPLIRRAMAVLACLAALLGTDDARAGDPPPPGAVRGTVVRAADGAPLAYATVADTALRIGTICDERGRFLLGELPPGRVTLLVRSLGSPPLVETLDLAPGDTLSRTYALASRERESMLQMRDSLTARGLWPPTLDRALRAHMREALDVRVFRLDPDHPVHDAPPDPVGRIGPWPILIEADRPDRALVEGLIGTLDHAELYRANAIGAVKVCAGGFAPAIAVRFTSTGVPVDVLLCYACGEFAIWRDGRPRQSGDFESRAPEFVRFAKRLFPRDPAIRRLGAKPSAATRAAR